jgi:hypothetical protein
MSTFPDLLRHSRRAWLLLLIAAYLFAQQPAAPAEVFSPVLAQLKQQTLLSILLPDHLPPLAESSVYAHVSGDADSYSIRLESDPDCDGANACFLGILRAKRGGHFSFPQAITIGDKVPGRYKGTTCGGSCSSPAIEWKSNGVLYTVQLTLHTGVEKKARSWMIDFAQECIQAGPR